MRRLLTRRSLWAVSAAIGLTVLCGGVTGRIVAGTRLGFVQGIVFAIQFVLFTGLVGRERPAERGEEGWAAGQK